MAERRKPTIVSGLALIERLSHAQAGESVSDLAKAIGMDVGQTHRLLASLAETGYVFQDQASSKYLLTPKLIHIAATLVSGTNLVEASREVMHELRDATGETVHVAASPGGTTPVCVARALALEPVSVSSSIGEVFPLDNSAIGEAVGRAPRSKSGRGSGDGRERSYAIDEGGYRPGVIAIAAPIGDWIDEVVGAIAVSGPDYRFTPDRIGELGEKTAAAAAAISWRLGHPADRDVAATEEEAGPE